MKTRFYSTFKILTAIVIVTAFVACNDDENDDNPSNVINILTGADAASQAQLAFIEVESDQVISFEAGTFNFTNTLSMNGKNNVVIRGAGRESTFLNFSGQTSGGDGVLVTNSNSIRFEDLTIVDAAGDALKARECDKISFVNVGTVWSGVPSEDNGAYGLYPVLCTEVFIDNCYAYGASDAGIYVGQSDLVIVKNSTVEGNVAGIEIENTTNADVFDNEAFDNTGGILVFDLPGLSQSGRATRIFNNNVYNNNRTNFAPAGNIVGNVPAGTGSMILSTKDVEIFNNTFADNNFSDVLIANYALINANITDPTFDPFASGIHIHDNSYGTRGVVNPVQPALISQLIGVLNTYSLNQPDIITDGLIMAATDICINEDMGTTFINMNAGDPTFASVVTDISVHACTPAALSEVVFTPY